MSDTDPENEIGNVPGPADRNLISPYAYAGGNQVSNTKKSKRRGAGSDREGHPPPARCRLLHDSGDPFCQPAKVAPVQNKRYARELLFRLFDFWCCWGCVHDQLRIVECGLRITGGFMLVSPQNLQRRYFPRPAFLDSDYECARDS